MKSIFRIFALNILLLLAVFIIFELIFGSWVSFFMSAFATNDPKSRFTDRYYETVFIMCPDKYLHHQYCPNISYRKNLSASDGGEIITSYVNKSSVRVANAIDMATTTNPSTFDIINIGDSLVQAKEVPYEDTFSRVLESATGKKVLQIGMGGWAPINYYAWLKHNSLREGVEVNLFVPPNDFLPNNPSSNLKYYQIGQVDENGDLIFKDFNIAWSIFDEVEVPARLKHLLELNSVLYRLFVRVRTRLRGKPLEQNIFSPNIFSNLLTETITDCSRKRNFKNLGVQTSDYLRLAFDTTCWDKELRNYVDSGIEDLKKVIQIVKNKKGIVRIFIVPGVLAFENEGEKMKTGDRFKMSKKAAITSEPLARYITAELENLPVEVISLENILRKKKLKNNEKLFFPQNAHWTREMNQFLGTWMFETFYQ
jgi:hypothetical protein